MTRADAITDDGIRYRDLNGNGRMDPFEDARLSPESRAEDLLARLSLAEKAGLLFHTMIGVGQIDDHDSPGVLSPHTPREMVVDRGINHFNAHALPSAATAARWQNALQELAEQTPHGIPITFSTDPRHAFAENSGVSFSAGPMSQWPEPIGLAAIGSEELVRRYGDIVRREYRAVGIRCALHPQLDLATDARWGRQAQTFGSDAATTASLGRAYIEALQGPELGPDSVAAVAKHFPGGGPLRGGEDSHFRYGREQVYPGHRFDDHLEPFRAAIDAGVSSVMSAYGMPVGLALDGVPVEEVAFGFNSRILTGLLRDELGFDGVILSDWGLVTDVEIAGLPFPARAWGAEHLDRPARVQKILDAGVDQLGGEDCVDLVIGLVNSGRVSEARLDESARRVLLVKFRLGLFDDPYVDVDEATRIVGSDEFRALGRAAQSRAVTVLRNGADAAHLPLRPALRVHLDGIDAGALPASATPAPSPAEADVAIVRLPAPFDERDEFFLESAFHQGSLEFDPVVIDRVRALSAVVPVVLDVALDRPAILTELDDVVSTLTVSFGASDAALLAALTGRVAPEGRLPVELPRSMGAVRAGREDVPSDTADPLYPAGAGQAI